MNRVKTGKGEPWLWHNLTWGDSKIGSKLSVLLKLVTSLQLVLTSFAMLCLSCDIIAPVWSQVWS